MGFYSFGMMEFGNEVEIDFATFTELVKGRSIVSLADWGEDRIEFGLSGGKMIRIFLTEHGIHTNFISTINKDEIPPVTINLGELSQRTPIYVIERKLKGLRIIYGILYLLQNREYDILLDLSDNNFENIECNIPDEDKLFLESTSYGSWILTLWSKAKDSFQTLLLTLVIVYQRSREAMLKKLEAQAELKLIDVDMKRFELDKKKMDYVLELTQRIDNENLRRKLENKISESIEDLISGEEKN